MNPDDNVDEVLSTLRQIIRAIDLQSKKLAKQYGLTGPQLIVLKEIRKSPLRPIAEISRSVSLSQATVTSILDRLEQQGLARRKRSEEDKRRVHIELTEKAESILAEKPSLLQEEFSSRFDTLDSWEKHFILSALQRLAGMMNAESIESPPMLVSGPIDASSNAVDRYLSEENTLKS